MRGVHSQGRLRPGVFVKRRRRTGPRLQWIEAARESRLPGRPPGREAMAMIHQDVALVVQPGLLRPALAKQARVRVRCRLVRGVGASRPVAVHCRVAGIVRRRRRDIFALEALEPRPRLNERAVDSEVLVREQLPLPGLREHGLEEGLGHLTVEQALPILREHADVPDAIVHDQPVEQVLVALLHELLLAADAQDLEQQRAQQPLGRDRRPPCLRVQLAEPRRQLREDCIHERAQRPERMVLRMRCSGAM
jgi:hypothetical protein